ncbi:Vestitone reductase [Vitis vinifera]|uniref:Vestitone reductase n=1 Tax=Vitis vinifera TaxID=29760 RepID=A0A438DZU6_VITVI|nr:Vestitone reductase [Vitis vinifera]
MEGENEKGRVCVTGGTGFIASWLIMKLLQHGYSVNATIRSHPGSKKDISYITNLPGASEKLQIFNADLSEPHSFEPALEGCIGVFHVAHPVDFEAREPEETVTRRSVEGTLAILKACLNSKTDESSWSDVEFIRSLGSFAGPYMISKTETERAALEFAEKHGLDLVTLLPSFVVGPFLCPFLPGSVQMALTMIKDDVASAHIFLLHYPNAKGRYNCSSNTITINEMSEFLSAKYPQLPIPTTESLSGIQGYRTPGLSSKKLLDTGFVFKHGLDEMFDGAVQCCKEKGFL